MKHKVVVRQLSNRRYVHEAMLNCSGTNYCSSQEKIATLVKLLDKGLSDKKFFTLLLDKHSPIEQMIFKIDLFVPDSTHVHLVRHKEISKYVATSRKDIPYSTPLEDGMRYMTLVVNVKRLIEISEQRLCLASKYETRKVWEEAVNQIISIEPLLRYFLIKPCERVGYCVRLERECPYNFMPNYNKLKAYIDKQRREHESRIISQQ